MDTQINDLADLLDSRTVLTGRRTRSSTVLKEASRRVLGRFLVEFVLGRRGPRLAYVKHFIRRFGGRDSSFHEELAALISSTSTEATARTPRFKSGIAHYGLFRAEIGIGQGARRLATAMKTAEIPLSLHNISLPQFQSKVEFEASDEPVSNYDTTIFQLNADTFLDLFELFPLRALVGRRRIAHWVWELPVLPPRWIPAISKFHEIWTPSRFVAEAVANATEKPVRIVPYPVPIEDVPQTQAREELGLPRDALIFLTIFDSNSYAIRKNVLGAIRAFLDAFLGRRDSTPFLVIKCHGVGNRGTEFHKLKDLAAKHPSLILIDRVFTQNEMTLLQSACDCFVSLHRAEGFGLNIAECMGKGKLVIATDYSGSTDFARSENSLLVPYKMAEVGRQNYIYGGGQWWAEPDHDAAVAAMRHAATNGSDVKQLAARARKDIALGYSYEAIGKIAKAAWKQELSPFIPE